MVEWSFVTFSTICILPLQKVRARSGSWHRVLECLEVTAPHNTKTAKSYYSINIHCSTSQHTFSATTTRNASITTFYIASTVSTVSTPVTITLLHWLIAQADSGGRVATTYPSISTSISSVNPLTKDQSLVFVTTHNEIQKRQLPKKQQLFGPALQLLQIFKVLWWCQRIGWITCWVWKIGRNLTWAT